jgi:hypothetical protein
MKLEIDLVIRFTEEDWRKVCDRKVLQEIPDYAVKEIVDYVHGELEGRCLKLSEEDEMLLANLFAMLVKKEVEGVIEELKKKGTMLSKDDVKKLWCDLGSCKAKMLGILRPPKTSSFSQVLPFFLETLLRLLRFQIFLDGILGTGSVSKNCFPFP